MAKEKGERERNRSLLYFPTGNRMDTQVQVIENMIQEILADDPAYFLVELRIKPINNIKVFLDGDNGIALEKCIIYNRALYKKIEEAALFPNGDFSLEVSSPGVDEPLKLLRQYKKNIGRPVEVLLKDGAKVTGKMISVQEDSLQVEEIKGKMIHGRPVGKKHEVLLHNFSFNDIKSTKIQTVF